VEQKSLSLIFSSAAPQRTADSEVPFQMAEGLAVHCRLGRFFAISTFLLTKIRYRTVPYPVLDSEISKKPDPKQIASDPPHW
jgi:hypothetical protein